jgi:hypothetical protein
MKSGASRVTAANHEMRDEEVLRANKELAAYFRGKRTEREARAALKIIKAFIRERERADPRSLRPLPGPKSGTVPKRSASRKIKAVRMKAGQPLRRPFDRALADRREPEPKAPLGETLARDKPE